MKLLVAMFNAQASPSRVCRSPQMLHHMFKTNHICDGSENGTETTCHGWAELTPSPRSCIWGTRSRRFIRSSQVQELGQRIDERLRLVKDRFDERMQSFQDRSWELGPRNAVAFASLGMYMWSMMLCLFLCSGRRQHEVRANDVFCKFLRMAFVSMPSECPAASTGLPRLM